MAEATNDQGQVNIMKELSDIKSSLAVNTSETSNIKANISEIKSDIKEIKNDFVARREFNEALVTIREEIAPLRKFIYAIISAFGLAIIAAIASLIIKA